MSATSLSSSASIAALLGIGEVMCAVTDCDRLRPCAWVDWFGGGNGVETSAWMLKDPIFGSSGLSAYPPLAVGGRLD